MCCAVHSTGIPSHVAKGETTLSILARNFVKGVASTLCARTHAFTFSLAHLLESPRLYLMHPIARGTLGEDR